jgi:lysine/ornithine N-monooxygenase
MMYEKQVFYPETEAISIAQ